MTDKLPVNGQVIGETERALEPLLDGLLRKLGTNFPTRVALQLLTTKGPVVSRADLERDLEALLRQRDLAAVQDASSSGLVDQLESAGLIRPVSGQGLGNGQVEMTDAGRTLHQRIVEGIARNSAELFGGIDIDDLATTRRVLVLVTERARSMHKR
jgi:DNA-binding MarR family transcriptional regulator